MSSQAGLGPLLAPSRPQEVSGLSGQGSNRGPTRSHNSSSGWLASGLKTSFAWRLTVLTIWIGPQAKCRASHQHPP